MTLQTSALLAIASEIIGKVQFCFAVTVADNHETIARLIQPGPLQGLSSSVLVRDGRRLGWRHYATSQPPR